jgi:hypothetical protein
MRVVSIITHGTVLSCGIECRQDAECFFFFAFDAPAMTQPQAALLTCMNELDLRWIRPRRRASGLRL